MREMEDDVARLRDAEDIDEVERLSAIQAELQMLRERCTAEENELAEIAAAYRPSRLAA